MTQLLRVRALNSFDKPCILRIFTKNAKQTFQCLGWASLLGQQGLVRAQEIKMEAIRKAPKPPPGQNTIQLGQEVAQEMHVCRMDALVFLLMSNQFFEAALTTKPETLGGMEPATAYRLYNLARVALGFAFRHTCVASLL